MVFADIVGKVFAIPGCVGTAFLISPGIRTRKVLVTEIYSGRSWEEHWDSEQSGLHKRIAEGDLVEIRKVEVV